MEEKKVPGEHNTAHYPLSPLCRSLGRRQRALQGERTGVTARVSWTHACSRRSDSPHWAHGRGSGTARLQKRLAAGSTQPPVTTCSLPAAAGGRDGAGLHCRISPTSEHPPQRSPPASGHDGETLHMALHGQDASQLPRYTSTSHTSIPCQRLPHPLLAQAGESLRKSPRSTRVLPAQDSAPAQMPASAQAAGATGSGGFSGAGWHSLLLGVWLQGQAPL